MITPSFGLTATERVLPKLALDFTTANLDPRITFTRTGNTATVINSSGVIQTVNADVPRFDYDPTTLICKGLLIEEQRQNYLQYSNGFSNTGYWNVNNTITVSTGVADPWGGTTACTLTANGATSYLGRSYTGTASVAYTGSLWIRRRTGTGSIGLRIGDNTTTFITGSVTSAWTRVPVTSTPSTTTVRFYIVVNTSGDAIDVWGAQLELGSFATSYIPNDAVSQNIRYADVATMTGTNFSDWWTATTGATNILAIPKAITGTNPLFQLDDNTADNIISLRGNAANPELYIKTTTDQAQIDAGTIVANTAYKLTGAWNTNDCAAAQNGAATVTDTSATIPNVTQARIGSNGTNYANAWLQKINYWPQRLTNNEVQSFSK